MGSKDDKENAIKWRLCPAGQHWRSKHIQSTYTKTDGTVVREHSVSAGCCDNPSKKDQIYSDELIEIAKTHFSKLDGPPKAIPWTFSQKGLKAGNRYDEFIRGWTQFWNDVLNVKDKLDPNLVKALIGSESSFDSTKVIKDSKVNGYARGLMQVTDATQRILGNSKGELKDHLVHIDQKDMLDPSLNIAAGTRWLFWKKERASAKLGREATWKEMIAEYKGVLKELGNNPTSTPRALKNIFKYYDELNKK